MGADNVGLRIASHCPLKADSPIEIALLKELPCGSMDPFEKWLGLVIFVSMLGFLDLAQVEL